MKKIFFLISCVVLVSCSKDSNTPSGTTATGSVQYKINGNLVLMDNVDLLSGQYVTFAKQLKGILPETRYLFNGQKGANNFITFVIITDSLHEINYHYDFAFNYAVLLIIDYNGQNSRLAFNGDYLDINVNSYKNGRVSASFTGRYTPYSNGVLGIPGSVVITEGEIKNVQVIY